MARTRRPTDAARLKRLKKGKRWILCLDGGGIRGIITLYCLKKLEEHYGFSCFQMFDMFAGTSTGAIIAGCLAREFTVDQLIELYRDNKAEIFHPTTFPKMAHGVLWAIGVFLIFVAVDLPVGKLLHLEFFTFQFFVSLLVLTLLAGALFGKFLFNPDYSKKGIRKILQDKFGDAKLSHCERDILITAKDVMRSETTFFTAFRHPKRPQDVRGNYRQVRLRDAVEASISAPTYFLPHERFIDGGVGSFNNPSYMAAVEALRYSNRPAVQRNGLFRYKPGDNLYHRRKVLVFSFGTGEEINNMSPKKAYQAPTKLFWSSYVMGDVMDDANAVQNYVCSRELEAEEKAIEFRRFQIDLGMKAMKEVGVSLEELKPIVPFMKREPDFSRLKMDSIRHFGLFELIGRKFADYLSQKRLFRTKGVEVGQTLLKASEVLRYVSEVENGFTGIKD